MSLAKEIHGANLTNNYLKSMEVDHLYHLGLTKQGDNLEKDFGDVRFICTGGAAHRMYTYALMMKEELRIDGDLIDLSADGHRFSMYKVGPVIFINHGMGVPSLSILLHELFKLVAYAKCKDVVFFRLGTCGGLGKAPGTVIVSKRCVDNQCRSTFRIVKLGKEINMEATLDQELANNLINYASANHPDIPIEPGCTMTTDDFYEGQARCDGAFCDFTREQASIYLNEIAAKGVTNIEMEATCFAAMCTKARVKCAIVNVILVDRLEGDQVRVDKETYNNFQVRPFTIISNYIESIINS